VYLASLDRCPQKTLEPLAQHRLAVVRRRLSSYPFPLATNASLAEHSTAIKDGKRLLAEDHTATVEIGK